MFRLSSALLKHPKLAQMEKSIMLGLICTLFLDQNLSDFDVKILNLRYFHGSLFLITSDNDFNIFCTRVTLIWRQYVQTRKHTAGNTDTLKIPNSIKMKGTGQIISSLWKGSIEFLPGNVT